MDRLSQLRGGAGGSRDTSLDGSEHGDSFMTATDTPSKYYSLSEDDSFDINKDVSLASTSSENTLNDSDCFSNLSPIGKKDLLDYKIGKQIEAANILSGGVNIFDDNESSYDGNELVIDDNVEIGDSCDKSPTLKSPDNPILPLQDDNVDKSPNLKSPDSPHVLLHEESIEPGGSSTLKSTGCSTLTMQNDTVDTSEKSPDLKSAEGSELPTNKGDEPPNEIADLPLEQADEQVMDGPNPPLEQVAENDLPLENGDEHIDNNLVEEVNEDRTEVVLQIDGNNVDAINIGTGLYLYRKQGQEELAAVQIVEDEEPSFKFLKVRENAEGNLEVYEEIQEVIVVPQEMPIRETRPPAPSAPKEPNKPVNEPSTSKPVVEKKNAPDREEPVASTSRQDNGPARDVPKDTKCERNLNGKMVKISESRKSPLMAYHSTPNKEGIPLTKTMVDQQLHPNRHSDNIKKTIEVHTDNSKQKISETPTKSVTSPDKISEDVPRVNKSNDKETHGKQHISIVTKENTTEVIEKKIGEVDGCSNVRASDKTVDAVAGCSKVEATHKTVDEVAGCSKVGASHKTVDEVAGCSKVGASHKTVDVVAGCSNVGASHKTVDEVAGCSNVGASHKIVDEVAGCSNVELSLKKVDDVAGGSNVEASHKKVDGIAGCSYVKESHKKMDEVASCSNIGTSHKLEAPKEKAEEVKASPNNEVTVDKALIVADGEKKVTISSKESESPSVIPHTSGCMKIVDVNNTNTMKETGSSNIKTTKKEVKGKSTSTTSSLLEGPINIDEYKIPENKDHKENPAVLPTENVESDDMDDDALVIEEGTIDSQPELHKSENKELELGPLAVEVKSKVKDNPNKKTKWLDCAKPSTVVGVTNTSEPSQIDDTTANLKTSYNINIIKNDKLITENKSDNKLNTQNSLISNQVKCTNSKDTQLNNSIKKIETTKAKESSTPVKENLTENLEERKTKETLTENKSAAVESTKSNAKVHDASNNVQAKPAYVTSQLEATVKKQVNINLTNAKDVKTLSLLPIKHQQPTNLPEITQNVVKPQAKSDNKPTVVNAADDKKEVNHKLVQNASDTKPKSINNNHAPVPFGKWTEANRQDFLNKIKESKVPVNMSNANQLKQPNDLNRRDVLKKIDSQRQTYNANVKIQESLQKANTKAETAFASKVAPATVTKRETKVPVKCDAPILKHKPIVIKKAVQEPIQPAPQETIVANTISSTTKNETQRKEINNQDLIDKTIEGIINRAVTGKSPEDIKQTVTEKPIAEKLDKKPEQKTSQHNSQPTLLDAIEMKMNELHGIPFVERPPHELPHPYLVETNVSPKNEIQNIPQKVIKIPNLLPLSKSQQKLKDCEDDIMNLDTPKEKSAVPANVPSKLTEKPLTKAVTTQEQNKTGKDKIITEKEFEKFARRNSVTYENCLTVTDSHQVIQTVIPREAPPKKISRNEQMLAEAKAKSPHKHLPIKQYHPSKAANKCMPVSDNQNKQYQSKVQLAYQTAITAKRRIDSPITIIEDKPVKVVYLDSNVSEFATGQLNVQGRDLSPAKRPEPDAVTVGTGDSLDSDILDAMEDVRAPDDTRTKTKHQRKQVLTPVETPDLELIEPGDLGIEISPKKKRKIEDKAERSPKNLVPKKSYLLGRSAAPARPASESVALATNPPPEVTLPSIVPPVTHDASSAIDNLVKAAELLENQSESINTSNVSVESVDGVQGTPVKRGRGRPRKHPLPAGSDVKVSPEKKPRLMDAKTTHISSSDDDSSDDDSMIKENWTMGKINEKIVCPICNKLFRSENVVFKHVKHCAGPSPSRSDQDKRSPRRSRLSQESETYSRDSEVKSRDSRQDEPEDDVPLARKTTRKRKSKDSGKSSSSDEVIPIEPKEPEDDDLPKKNEPRKIIRPRINTRANNLVCEICGKSFRQLSYLVSHRLQHKKEDAKKPANHPQSSDKSVFSCETCKKEFRKLHHLVQHRLIHNPVQSRVLRKTSSEQKELLKAQDASKVEDQSAGFRCEPCDKSFRKLHHLVEHRETHDGINRQRSNSVTQIVPEKEKPTPPPQCDICKKTFRKLHHLIEHKEQHFETSSEKSDDQKSVKSSLSTKDIIHECNLCYMVFPNEHSLNKHAVNCLRKKKQSAAKQAATLEEKNAKDGANAELAEENKVELVKEPQPMETDIVEEKMIKTPEKLIDPPAKIDVPPVKEPPPKTEVVKTVNKLEKEINEPKPAAEKKATPLPENPVLKVVSKPAAEKKATPLPENSIPKVVSKPAEPAKIQQVDEIIVIEDTPKKKVPLKDRVAATVTKRQKAITAPPPVEERTAPAVSSDEDEIRYMINPDFKAEDTAESKNFMKVRAKKRSSLQIERPNSKDLVTRQSLLQHPPKVSRLRAKSDDVVASNALPKPAIKPKVEKIEVPSTDSDDSDVKYSFPKTVPEKPAPATKQEPKVEIDKKRRKTMVEKRKSLGGIAKRKSMGKAIAKPAAAAKPSPAKPIKRRTMAVEHRCDCGALFSSAALLARHATLAHTPPRVRRRRDADPAPAAAAAPSARKSSSKSETAEKPDKTGRKSAVNSARKLDTVKAVKSRNRVHGGVPLPEKRVPRK